MDLISPGIINLLVIAPGAARVRRKWVLPWRSSARTWPGRPWSSGPRVTSAVAPMCRASPQPSSRPCPPSWRFRSPGRRRCRPCGSRPRPSTCGEALHHEARQGEDGECQDQQDQEGHPAEIDPRHHRGGPPPRAVPLGTGGWCSRSRGRRRRRPDERGGCGRRLFARRGDVVGQSRPGALPAPSTSPERDCPRRRDRASTATRPAITTAARVKGNRAGPARGPTSESRSWIVSTATTPSSAGSRRSSRAGPHDFAGGPPRRPRPVPPGPA
jgi:hypothetical protein